MCVKLWIFNTFSYLWNAEFFYFYIKIIIMLNKLLKVFAEDREYEKSNINGKR